MTQAGATLDLDTVLHGVLGVLKTEFGQKDPTATPYVMLYDDREDVLELPAVVREFYQPTHPEYRDRVRLPLSGKGITCDIARKARFKKDMLVENVKNVHKDQVRYVEVNTDTQSELCAGLVSEERLLGVLVIKSDILTAFNEDDEKLFEMAARQVALALDRLDRSALAQRRVSVAGAMAWASDIAHDINSDVGYIRNRASWLKTTEKAISSDGIAWAGEIDERAGQLADTVRDPRGQWDDPALFSLKQLLEQKVPWWRKTNAPNVKIEITSEDDHTRLRLQGADLARGASPTAQRRRSDGQG